MTQNGVVCWPGPALLFFIFRYEYLISGPKRYPNFREMGPRFSIHGVHIARSYSGTQMESQENLSEVLVSHENGRPYLQAKIQSILVPFFRKSYACYSHMEIPLTTTIKIIIIVIIILFIKIKSP